MKKRLSLVLIAALTASCLVACGGKDSETTDKNITQSSDNVQEVTNVENTEVEEKVEIDTSIYSENVKLTTGEGKVVSIYYDPTIVTNLSGEDWNGKEEINLGEMMSIFVTDAESAKAYVDTVIGDNGGNINIGKQEEIPLSGYDIHYFTLNEPGSGAFLDKMWLIELDSDIVCRFMIIGEAAEGSQLEKELAAIKFVVGDVVVESGNNTEDKTEGNTDRDLQTCGILDMKIDQTGNVTYEESGILTYDAGKVEYVSTNEYGVEFNVSVKQDKTKYTLPVTLRIVRSADAEDFYQEWKNSTLEFDAGAEVSEMKETVINEITVGYFTRVYHSKDGEHENRDLYCFVEFPAIDNQEKGIEIWMPYTVEEDLLLSSLENLLVDVEIEGVKPSGATEDIVVGNEWPDFLPERPDAFEVLEVTVDQESNATHYNMDIGLVNYQIVKDYVDEIKNAGCDLENGHEKYSEESGYIAFEGVLDNHIITVYYDVEWNIFEIIIGE